jgi:uncharacterized ferritin-like protein (DUF455 family)
VIDISVDNLFEQALHCLSICEPAEKVSQTKNMYDFWQQGKLDCKSEFEPVQIVMPGKPDKPELVDPRKVPRRGFNSEMGRIRLVHAIAHIEFNAINLALDAVYRFREMPEQYYSDWLKVAAEEARHFTLLNDYLESKGANYGDYAAHNGLWEMAVKTDHDVMVRMALVPRVLEARGLDVTPGMIHKLELVGETELVEILKIIHHEEIGHVKIGSYWFSGICDQRNLSSDETFTLLLDEYMKDVVFGAFDEDVRLQAGFTRQELSYLRAHS